MDDATEWGHGIELPMCLQRSRSIRPVRLIGI